MKEIPLSRGKVAFVDDRDYEWLNQWKWTYIKTRPMAYTGYAVRSDYSVTPCKCIYMHRLILDCNEGEEADHIDRDGLDNRHCNLRKATHSQNMQNSRIRRSPQSPYKGIFQNRGKWVAAIRNVHLGTFWTSVEAAYVFDQAALRDYGEFARTNGITREELAQAKEEAKKLESTFVSTIHLGNSKKRHGTSSRYMGVSWAKKDQCWRAEIRLNYKLIWLGHFDSEEEAARVWNAAAIKHRGVKARLNVFL